MEWGAILQGVLGGLIPALIAGVIAWYKLRPEIKKTDAETADIVGKTWLALVAPMREEITSLRAQIKCVEADIKKRDIAREEDRLRIAELEEEVVILKQQIVELGHQPRTRRNNAR